MHFNSVSASAVLQRVQKQTENTRQINKKSYISEYNETVYKHYITLHDYVGVIYRSQATLVLTVLRSKLRHLKDTLL